MDTIRNVMHVKWDIVLSVKEDGWPTILKILHMETLRLCALDSKVTWHVPGHGPPSGDYAGLESIGDFFGGSSEDTFSIDVDKVFGDDDVVVVLVTVNEQRRRTSGE